MCAWDNDKSTAADPDNPAADEQLTADEWDNHVADQKSRVLYGPVADRPAAGDVPNGTVYLITDLANNGGVLKVVAGAWEIKQIGDDANRPDIVGGTGDFNSVDVDEATSDFLNLGMNISGGVERSARIGDAGAIRASDSFVLGDDSTEILFPDINFGKVALCLIKNVEDAETAIVSGNFTTVDIISSNGPWSASDSDGDNSVFVDGGDFVIKNRKGGE